MQTILVRTNSDTKIINFEFNIGVLFNRKFLIKPDKMLISLRPSKKQGILVLLFRLLFFTSKLSEEKAAQDANSLGVILKIPNFYERQRKENNAFKLIL